MSEALSNLSGSQLLWLAFWILLFLYLSIYSISVAWQKRGEAKAKMVKAEAKTKPDEEKAPPPDGYGIRGRNNPDGMSQPDRSDGMSQP